MDQADQFFAEVWCKWSLSVLQQVQTDVVLEDLGHEPMDATLSLQQALQLVGATVFRNQGRIYRIHLPASTLTRFKNFVRSMNFLLRCLLLHTIGGYTISAMGR